MGGVDKGLQNFNGTPLALHTVMRLQMQAGGLIGDLMINANRNLSAYEAFGAPVWPDTLSDYAGPLAGFMTGLERCETPYLLTAPCDTPLFPLDLALRLAQAFEDGSTEIAMAAAREADGQVRTQPVFCLMRVNLLKRMESSVYSFALTVGRQLKDVDATLARIEAHKLAKDGERDDVLHHKDADGGAAVGGKRRAGHARHLRAPYPGRPVGPRCRIYGAGSVAR